MKLTTHLSIPWPWGWQAELALLADLQRTVYQYKWLPISCRSGADQWKFAGQRPTFYHWATQPIKSIKYRENKLIVTKYVKNVRHWLIHKHASAFVIGQLRHQSATAPSRATHAVDAARSSAMSWTLVSYTRCWMTDHSARHVATELTRPQSGGLCHLVCHSA